ncbi:MAG: sulfate ABC transporter substrate-binding protein [Xenophilus sp.]
MKRIQWLNGAAVALVVAAAAAIGLHNRGSGAASLLNVSYDPTRELFADINRAFLAQRASSGGDAAPLVIRQSHGGSSRQARAVIAGTEAADVVTLGLPSDIDALQQRGLVAANWRERLPDQARPFYSTIVFVVRKGNPLALHDWPDLVKPGVQIVTPDPKSSGNGKLSALAAWGSVVTRGGSEQQAAEFLKALYTHTTGVLAAGARGAAVEFAIEKQGDVHLTWENEALREVAESGGELALVYPPVSIRAEPSAAWVDANVAKHGTEAAARAYLQYLFTAPAQEIAARAGYRPSDPAVARRHAGEFGALALFDITAIAPSWAAAQQRFFAENGVLDNALPAKAL